MTAIEWTDATWNPVRGCSVVSPGCTHCYAMKMAHRFSGAGQAYEGLTQLTKGGPVWTGKVRLVPEVLDAPLRWRKPRRIFVNSMSDLFHDGVHDEFVDRVFAVMALAPRHTFQVLTKRPERMHRYMMRRHSSAGLDLLVRRAGADSWPKVPVKTTREIDAACGRWHDGLPNLWLGVSVEDQARADERIPLLLETPAAVRFLSVEPLLARTSLARWLPIWFDSADATWRKADEHNPGAGVHLRRGIDWVIVGGESGPGARPCDAAWIRSIVEQCRAASKPVFVKQLGARPLMTCDDWRAVAVASNRGEFGISAAGLVDRKGGDPDEWPADLRVREFPTERTA